jgi:hypothetical protein
MRNLIPLLALPAVLAGCWDGGRHPGWERSRALIGPLPMKDRIAYVDGARDQVVAVDLGGDDPAIHAWAIGRRALFATPTPDRRRLAVITRGEEATAEGLIDQEPLLWLVDLDDPAAVPPAYPIGSPFDRLAVAADGSLAVAYFSDAGPDADGVFRNPNELAVIDLARPPGGDNPVLKTVRSFGAAPDGVVLSPPMAIPDAADGSPRTFAFILAADTVTILDASHPLRREVSIRLDLGDEQVRPREVVFDPGTATAYLRSDNARDVLEVRIGAEEPAAGDPEDNDFRPALAELGAGGGPADIAVWDDAFARRFVIAATPNTGEVVVIDAATGQFTAVATPDPIDRILLFPTDAAQVPHTALLASLGGRLPRVHLLGLEGLTEDLVRADLRTIELERPVLDVVPVPGRELAMIVHDDDRTVLGLLDAGQGTVAPLQGVGRLDSYAFTRDGAFLVGITHEVDRVGFLDLDNLHPSDLRLDDLPERVFTLDNGTIFVDHGDPLGLATVVPSPAAGRGDATVLRGFLLTGLLDQEIDP